MYVISVYEKNKKNGNFICVKVMSDFMIFPKATNINKGIVRLSVYWVQAPLLIERNWEKDKLVVSDISWRLVKVVWGNPT